MIFNNHSTLAGQHAFLSASKYHWINYDDEKLDRVYVAALAAQRGTELHALAHELIRLGVKLPRSQKTLNLYVNDALGFRMAPEQILYYSDNCFGTADAISFRTRKLRISDLKTGATPTSEHQLEVYAALFCLEYRVKPFDIDIELRIYQNDEVREYIGDPDVIMHIMDKIMTFDKRITILRQEALL
jgi:Protein of unknown function (DUF2800).